MNAAAAGDRSAGSAGSAPNCNNRSSAAFAIGDGERAIVVAVSRRVGASCCSRSSAELRMVTVQFESAAGQGYAVVDSDSLDHATPPLPMNRLEYVMMGCLGSFFIWVFKYYFVYRTHSSFMRILLTSDSLPLTYLW